MKITTILSALLLSCSFSNIAAAGIIDTGDVNGLKTFQDTTTKLYWLDMNNFFSPATGGQTGLQMIATAQAAGFTVANKAEVATLLNGVALGGNFSNAAAIMGYGAPRQLIWGMYEDSLATPAYGWAFAFSGDLQWNYTDNTYNASTLINSDDRNAQDLGLFAYSAQGPAVVPEPGSVALLGLGIAGLLVARRRKQAA